MSKNMNQNMNQKIFVPLTDELLYDHPELITAPLRPFNAGQPCFHWMGDWAIDESGHDSTNGSTAAKIELSKPEKPAS